MREAKSRKHEKAKAGKDDSNGELGPEARLTEQQKGELMACFNSFDEDNSGFL